MCKAMSFSSCSAAVISRSASRSICRSRLVAAPIASRAGSGFPARTAPGRSPPATRHRRGKERKGIERRDAGHHAGVDRDPRPRTTIACSSDRRPAHRDIDDGSLSRWMGDRLRSNGPIARLDRFEFSDGHARAGLWRVLRGHGPDQCTELAMRFSLSIGLVNDRFALAQHVGPEVAGLLDPRRHVSSG